jgi:ubiquitin C-terminal hydrolase
LVFQYVEKEFLEEPENSFIFTTPFSMLPICDVVICYDEADLGPSWSCLRRNLLRGYAHTTPTEDENIVDAPKSFIFYRRRSTQDKLVWSPKHLQLGDLLDAKDDQNNWCFATVIDTDDQLGIRIHYTRWTSNYDEWIERSETRRLAEYGTKSTEETTITRAKTWETTVPLIQTKIDRFSALLEEQNYDKIDDYLEAQLNMFVSQCIGYSIRCTDDVDHTREECVDKIVELLELIVRISVWQLKNMKRAPSIKLLELLKLTLLSDSSDTGVNYFFEEHGHEPLTTTTMEDLQHEEDVLEWSSLLSSATTSDTSSSDNSLTSVDLKKSRHYFRLYNLFGRMGGLDAILARIEGEVLTSHDASHQNKQNQSSKPVSDLTGFDITHTSDQMGPVGYRRVMTGGRQSSGNMTKPLSAAVHNNGDKVVDTYIWQDKNHNESNQVYDVDVVYGADTPAPPDFEKCDKTLTPQLPPSQQSFLCYRTIHEDDKDSILARFSSIDTAAADQSPTVLSETKSSSTNETNGDIDDATSSPPSSPSPSSPSPSSPLPSSPSALYGKVFTLETLGLLTSIVSTPSSLYTPKRAVMFVPVFVTKVFQRLSSMTDDELNSLDTETLNNDTLPGLVSLQQVYDRETLSSTGGQYLDAVDSMSNQLKMFQLTLTRKFLICGYLQKRLTGVDMLMEWIRCAQANDAAAAASSCNSTTIVDGTNKGNTTDDTSDSDSDEYRSVRNRRRGQTNNSYRYGGTVGYSSTSGRYGGSYSSSYNSTYNGGYNHYGSNNQYGNQSLDKEEVENVPEHAKWITVSQLLQWMDKTSIVQVLLMGNKLLCERARRIHASNPTPETEAACRMENYPGVSGHPQVAKKSFQYHKKIKTSLIKFLSKPHCKKYENGQGYGGLTPKVLDTIWLGVRGGSMSVTAVDTIVDALRRATKVLPADSFVYVVEKYLSDPSFGDDTTPFHVRESLVKFIVSSAKRTYKRYELLDESSSDDDDDAAGSEEKKGEHGGMSLFDSIQRARSVWMSCLDRMFELCFPTSNTCSQSVQCVDNGVRGTVDNVFLECMDTWDNDQPMIESYLLRMVQLVENVNSTEKDIRYDAERESFFCLWLLFCFTFITLTYLLSLSLTLSIVSIYYYRYYYRSHKLLFWISPSFPINTGALAGLSQVHALYTSKSHEALMYAALFKLVLSLSARSRTRQVLEKLLEMGAIISNASETPVKSNTVHLKSDDLSNLCTSLLQLEESGRGGSGSKSSNTVGRLGVLWKWVQQGVSGTLTTSVDTVVMIMDDELQKMFTNSIIPAMSDVSLQGKCKMDARYLSLLFWSSMKKVNEPLGKVKFALSGKQFTYLGFNELEGMNCVWSFFENVNNDSTAWLMIDRCVRMLVQQHGSMKGSPFDTSKKASVWLEFVQRLHQETARVAGLPPPRRSNVKYLVRLYHTFLVRSRKIKLQYDEDLPEMLIGAKVDVTWCQNRSYPGEVEDYETDGEHAGMHKIIYTDGDIKYYRIRLVPTQSGSSYLLKAPNKGNDSDMHIVVVTQWSPSVAVPPEMEMEKTYAERCAFGQVAGWSNGNNNGNNNSSDYFQCVFDLLALDDVNKDVLHRAWILINSLPLHPRRRDALLNCAPGDDWSNIMVGSAPLQQLYSIQLIKTLLEESAAWSMQYINSGGFHYLVTSMLNSDLTPLVQDPMSRECVSSMLHLLRKFLLESKGESDQQDDEAFDDTTLPFEPTDLNTMESIAVHDFSSLIPHLMDCLYSLVEVVGKEARDEQRKIEANKDGPPLKQNVRNREEKERKERHLRDSKVLGSLIQTLAALCSRGGQTNAAIATNLCVKYNRMAELLQVGCLEMPRQRVRQQVTHAIRRICAVAENVASLPTSWSYLVNVMLQVGMSNDGHLLIKHQATSREYLNLLSALLLGGERANDLPRELLLNVCNAAAQVLMQHRDLKDGMLSGLFTCLQQSIGCLGSKEVEDNGNLFDVLSMYIMATCLFPSVEEGGVTASTIITPTCAHDPQLRKGAFGVLLQISKRSTAHSERIANILSKRHILGDIDIIGAKKNKKAGGQKRHATKLTALFETDDEDDDNDWLTSGTTSTTMTVANKWKSKYSWTDTKSDTGFVGLDNLACICYMNSSLQNLYMVPEFQRSILSVTQDITNPQNDGGGEGKRNQPHYSTSMFYQLQRLMSYLRGSEKRSYNPRSFCSTFPDLGNMENNVDVPTDVYQQHDATEFVLSLFNKLKDAVVGTPFADQILSMFNIEMFDEKTASIEGEPKRAVGEPFFSPMLRLNIEGHNDIRRALDEEFRGTEVDFRWPGDKESVQTIKRPTIKTLPTTLIIALNRFKSDYTQEPIVSVKINDKVAFPLVLDMNPYTAGGRKRIEEEKQRKEKLGVNDEATGKDQSKEEESKSGEGQNDNDEEEEEEEEEREEEVVSELGSSQSAAISSLTTTTQEEEAGKYELCGITIHSGNAGSGHYWSYAKDRATGKWSEFNDDSVTHWNIEDLARDCFGGTTSSTSTYKSSQNAYMLYYRRQSIAIEEAKEVVANIPSSLYAEIIGQNRVNAKKQSLVNFEYFDFVDQLMSSSQYQETNDNETKLANSPKMIIQPASAQLTRYSLMFLLGAFVHSGKDMLARIRGTNESIRAAKKLDAESSDSDEEGNKKQKQATNTQLSPLTEWRARLSVSLQAHPHVAVECLETLADTTGRDLLSFDRMFQYRDLFASAKNNNETTLSAMSRSILGQCLEISSKSASAEHQSSALRLVSLVCDRMIQWGQRTSDLESEETKLSTNSYSSATSSVSSSNYTTNYEWDDAKQLKQTWLRTLVQKYATNCTKGNGVARLLRSATRDIVNMRKVSISVHLGSLNCINALLRKHASRDVEIGENEDNNLEILHSLLRLVDIESFENVRSGMATSTMMCLVALAYPDLFLTHIASLLYTKVHGAMSNMDSTTVRPVFAIIRALLDALQAVADARSKDGPDEQCITCAHELMSIATDVTEKYSLSFFKETIMSMHLLIQLGRMCPLARSYYHEHLNPIFEWWAGWLQENRSHKDCPGCDQSNRPLPRLAKPTKKIYPAPKATVLLETISTIMSNGEDEIFSDTNITEEIHWYEGHPESLILRRVRVQWADADYEGTILSFDEESENHLVLYDDEEKKTYNVYRRLGVELLSADSVLPASSVVAKNGGKYFVKKKETE